MEIPVGKSNPWKDSLISGLIFILVGVLLAVLQEGALNIILIITGVLVVLYGLLTVYDGYRSGVPFHLGFGVLICILGALLIALPNVFTDLLMILLAIALIIGGVMSLSNLAPSFIATKETKILSGISGAVMLVLGVVALFNLDDTADVIMILIGVFVVISGLIKLYEAYVLKQWA